MVSAAVMTLSRLSPVSTRENLLRWFNLVGQSRLSEMGNPVFEINEMKKKYFRKIIISSSNKVVSERIFVPNLKLTFNMSGEVVSLNVGGTVFTTTVATLTQAPN